MVQQREDLQKPVQTGTLRKPCPHAAVQTGGGKAICLMCGRDVSMREPGK